MWLTRNCLKRKLFQWNCGGGKKKFSSSAKVFAQRCVIKQERWPTKASNGCSLKCLRRRGMFFSCQPAFDAGERGGDLAPPCACDGPTQVFRTIPCCQALDKLCEVPLATAVVWKNKKEGLFAFAVFVKWNFMLPQIINPRQLIYTTRRSQNQLIS